ncbi:MAG: AAA family ATPase [Candidatus Dormibacteraeota bacterium]|nr:AAA family ATPase [Candidatus Dormibacteraeota bacterium]
MTACPICGVDNPDGAQFCSSCGTRLRRGSQAREERKIVSVLFIDLVGFTARSDRADPEDIRDLLQLYHSLVKEQAERFGGSVEKFIGDAIMAVFGAPRAHTDDPERAVRAGLGALHALEELNRQRPGLGLTARAAVNTGEAVVAIGSGHERGEALALGDVVNTASRLQISAPVGRLVVGEETRRSTRDTVRYEELSPLEAKGKREPLGVWLAVEAVAGPAERAMRTTPFVGRDREFGLLESVWEGAIRENRPHLVTVIGPPGIGKSRLSREFATFVERGGGRAIRGRCLPYDTRDVYGAFAEQVKKVAQIFGQERPETARGKLGEAVSRLFDEAERQEVTRCLSLMLGLGLDQPVDEQVLLLFSARRLVERLGIEQPTLLVFEDVHWADAEQLDLIEYLAMHVREAPVVLLAQTRPELLDGRPAWGTRVREQTTISLEPVSDTDAATLVGHLLGDDPPPHPIARLVEVAGGNPLFLEELAAGLLEGADLAEEIPTTVRAAIAARVDALFPHHRNVLLAASVVGKVFWRGAVHALGRTEAIDEALDALETRDLIRREPTSQVRSDVEFSFKNMVLRDVCYATLPRAERRTAHESVARYIERVAGEKDRELAWLLAHHWEAAGDLARAVDYLLLAAERTQEAMAEHETVVLLERAQALAADEDVRTRIQLLLALARVRFEDFDRATIELEALVAKVHGRDELDVLLALARCYHWTERTTEVLEVGRRALEMAQNLGVTELVGPAMARLSQGHAMRGEEGDIDRAIQLGERAMEVWVPGRRLDDMAEHEHLLADQHYWTGHYGRALELSRAARDQAVDPSSAEALLRGGGMEGLLFTAMGRYEEALASFDKVIALGRELGRPVRVLLNYSTMAFRELYELDEARRRSEEALSQQGRSASFHMPWMNAAVDLIQTDLMAGEIGSAELRWRELWNEVVATPAWERWLLGGKMAALRAGIALETEPPEVAAEWASKAIAMARQVRRAKYENVARATLGKALMAMGRRQDALRQLQEAVKGADTLGNPAARWQVRADQAAILGAVGDDKGEDKALREAARIIRDMEASLAPERAKRFVATPLIDKVLTATT